MGSKIATHGRVRGLTFKPFRPGVQYVVARIASLRSYSYSGMPRHNLLASHNPRSTSGPPDIWGNRGISCGAYTLGVALNYPSIV